MCAPHSLKFRLCGPRPIGDDFAAPAGVGWGEHLAMSIYFWLSQLENATSD